MSMIEKSKGELVKSLNSAKAQLANIREKAQDGTKRAVTAGLSVGTGYGVGYLMKNHPDLATIPGADVDTPLAVGVTALLLGVTDMAGSQSDNLAAIGMGALSGYAAIKAYTSETESPKK